MLESTNIMSEGQDIETGPLLKKVIDEYNDLAQTSLHTLTLSMEEPLNPVFGLERLVREAVANLVTNAIKYTPLGGSIEVRASNQAGGVRIEVEDNGIGISAEDQQELFQEFVRLRPKPDKTGEVAGSGLGLSIVQRIVEMHHGHVTVHSEPNQGSTFVIELPGPHEESSHLP